ncbi:MAG: DUF3459 domain-containing protein, partial [Leptolyngbyaceae cyanobacterium SM2_5_2]|nr:DUF3459 domain-containing protein [Leptolyngbyaceae cyanobacterium SM2_5_2]
EQHSEGKHAALWRFYQLLLGLRRQIPALRIGDRNSLSVKCTPAKGLVCWQRWQANSEVLALINFQPEVVAYQPLLDGCWQRRLDSADGDWLGPGSQNPAVLETTVELRLWPQSFLLYERIDPDSPPLIGRVVC